MRLARGSNQIENLQITNSHINITFQSTFNSTTSGDSSSQARSFSSIFPHNVLHTPLHSFNISLDIRGLLTIQLIGEKTKKKLGLGLWRCLLITCLRIYALFKNMYLCIYIYIYIYMHSVHVSFHGAASELYFQTRARAICSQQGHQAQHVSTAGFSYQKPWSCRFSSPLSVPLRASLAGVQLI